MKKIKHSAIVNMKKCLPDHLTGHTGENPYRAATPETLNSFLAYAACGPSQTPLSFGLYILLVPESSYISALEDLGHF